MATNAVVMSTLGSSDSNETKTKKLSQVTRKVKVAGEIFKSDYDIVCAVLLKDLIPVMGSLKAQKELPEMLSQFLRKQFAGKAKAAKKAIAIRKVLAAHRDDIEADSK